MTLHEQQIGVGQGQSIDAIARWQSGEGQVGEVLRYVCEGSLDAGPILRAVNSAVGTMQLPSTERATEAEAIVRGIESHFAGRGLSYRLLLPFYDASPNAHLPPLVKLTNETVNLYNGLPQKTKDELPVLAHILMMVAESARRAQSTRQDARTVLVNFATARVYNHRHYEAVTQTHGELLNFLETEVYHPDFPDRNRLLVHQKLLDTAMTLSRTKLSPQSDLFTAEHNGVSLEQLSRVRDGQKFNQMALAYLAGMPKGDFLWSRFCEGFFLTVAHASHTVKTNTFFRYPHLARNLWGFKMHLSDAFFLPRVLGQAPDGDLDMAIGGMLGSLTDDGGANLFRMVINGALQGHANGSMFYPQNQNEATKVGRLNWHFFTHLPQRLMTIEEAAADSIWTSRTAYIGEWQERFPAVPALAGFIDGFRAGLPKLNYARYFTEQFVTYAKNRFPAEIWQQFIESEDAPQNIDALRRVFGVEGFVPSGRFGTLIKEVTATPGTFTDQIGLGKATFYRKDDPGLLADFVLLTVDSHEKVTGRIAETGEIVDLRWDDEVAPPNLKSIVEIVTQAYFKRVLDMEPQIETPATTEPATKSLKGNALSADEADRILREYLKEL